jgi:hypothetical protein
MILKGGFMLYESGRGVFDEANAGADEEKPRKGIEVKRARVRLTATDQTERALAPKSKDVKVSASKQGKRKPPSETQRRRPKKGNRKPEKEE